ncbi:MAG: IS256 family transposase [Acidobacteria bacterium]|nr:IS256 family transposase [Acidobacteriota bacterium]
MRDIRLFEELGQEGSGTVGEIFRSMIRGQVRWFIAEAMALEVEELCGAKHRPKGEDAYRAGSSPGRVRIGGAHAEVKRPRVRRRKADGGSEEVGLETYAAASDAGELEASILAALRAGVSTREVRDVVPDSPGTSRSSVSRLWCEIGHRFVDELRSRDLSAADWVAMMIDGIWLSSEETAVVALGIDRGGAKHVLDFELGSSENTEVCRSLMRRLVKRGFKCRRRLFAVLDGSDALRSALLEFFPDAVLQRCLVHKERNIKSKLSKKHWGEVTRLFKRLREVQGEDAANEVVDELAAFLKEKNQKAYESLLEAGDELTALHRLNVPNTLHRSLLSTNAIENSFRNTRRKLGRVTRFRAETDQASRWLAFSLLEVEKGFRRILGYAQIGSLVKTLEASGYGQEQGHVPVEGAFAYGSGSLYRNTRTLSTEP